MNGLTTRVTASNVSAPSCSVAEDVTVGGAVDDSADILARCANTFSVGGLRALTSSLDSGMTTGPSCDFEETASISRHHDWPVESCDSQQFE